MDFTIITNYHDNNFDQNIQKKNYNNKSGLKKYNNNCKFNTQQHLACTVSLGNQALKAPIILCNNINDNN